MRKLLVLDLYETLIHTTKEWIGYSTQYSIDNIGYVFQRPGLSEFITEIQSTYELACVEIFGRNDVAEKLNQLFK
ncbi:hypothetical protein MNBD_GAMMA12-6 [hydrothermal vent metagenome]|uniref:FCP1 homology domain-containing protein n=1 Tax=hydrothermal vent metagenome TaxID=652676 RepID=A0A3B0ZEG6_9ZZZZ